MNSSILAVLEYLEGHGATCEPGLDDEALSRFEETLGAALSSSERELYCACGGMTEGAIDHIPMRLMSPAEVVEFASVLSEGEGRYVPAMEAPHYVFADDQSNWAGVFAGGPLIGKVALVNHDEPMLGPRFGTLFSFLDCVLECGRTGADLWAARTDYPLRSESEADLVRDALPLARQFLDRAFSTEDVEVVVYSIDAALSLLPTTEVHVLRECLGSPHQYVRWRAIQLAGYQCQAELTPELVSYADRMKQEGNFTHWRTTMIALKAIGAADVLEAHRASLPKNWSMP